MQKYGWTLQIILRKEIHYMITFLHSSNTSKTNQWYYTSGNGYLYENKWQDEKVFKRLVMFYLSGSWSQMHVYAVCEKFLKVYVYNCALSQKTFPTNEKNLGFSRQEHKEKQILKHKMFKFINVQTQAMTVSPFLTFYSYLFIYLFIYCLFRAAPTAYGGSQARGLIRAVATSLRHSHSKARSEPSETYTILNILIRIFTLCHP